MGSPIQAAWAYMAASDRLQASLFTSIRKLWFGLPNAPEEARDVLVSQAQTLARYYGDAAVGLAAEFFEAATGLTTRVPGYDLTDAVEGSARWAAGDLFTGDPAEAQKKFRGAMQRHAKQPGRDLLHDNADRRGVRFARVPVGDTCSWCLMLASRGFIYTSSRHAGEGNRWHDWCDCMIVPSTEKDLPAEYDPEKLYELYNNVHESQMTGSQVAKAMREAYGLS